MIAAFNNDNDNVNGNENGARRPAPPPAQAPAPVVKLSKLSACRRAKLSSQGGGGRPVAPPLPPRSVFRHCLEALKPWLGRKQLIMNKC